MSFEGCVVFKILCSNVQVFMSLRKNKILKFEQLKKFSILYYTIEIIINSKKNKI